MHFLHVLSPQRIKLCLNEEAVHKLFILCYENTDYIKHNYVDLPHKVMPRKITNGMVVTTDTALTENDELTTRQLKEILTTQHSHLEVSIATVKRA